MVNGEFMEALKSFSECGKSMKARECKPYWLIRFSSVLEIRSIFWGDWEDENQWSQSDSEDLYGIVVWNRLQMFREVTGMIQKCIHNLEFN